MTKAIPEGMSASPFLEEDYMVAKRNTSFVRMNVFPSTHNGHLLFIPNDTDVQSPFQASQQELEDTATLMKQAAPSVLKNTLAPENRPEGYTIGWNIGLAGGQSIAHSHAHIIGRKKGDNIAEDGTRTNVRGGIINVLPTTDPFYTSEHPLEELNRDNVLLENNLAIVIPSPHPVVKNHVLVLPKRDVAHYHDLTAQEMAAMVTLSKEWLVKSHGVEIDNPGGDKGADIGWNVGEAAGQTYTSSAALEVVPRTLGDVAQARGGIAKIIPPADAAYYRGDKTGVKHDAGSGKHVTTDLEESRDAYYRDLIARARSVWPKQQGRAV